jgi:hypothetical protein
MQFRNLLLPDELAEIFGDISLKSTYFSEIPSFLGDFPLIKCIFFKNSGNNWTFFFEKVVFFWN